MNLIIYYSFNQWSQWHSMTLSFNRFIHWLLHAWSVDPNQLESLASKQYECDMSSWDWGCFSVLLAAPIGAQFHALTPEKSEIKRADMTTSPVHLLRCVPFQKPSIPHVHVGLYLFRETEKQCYFLHTQNDWNVRILIWPILAYPGMRIWVV